MNTTSQGTSLMKSARARRHNGASWHNQCASFVCCMISGITTAGLGAGASRPTARQALAASGPIVSTDPGKASPGDIGWWLNGGGDGHVAVYVGAGFWAMGSDAVPQGDGATWGDDSGTITLKRYDALRPDMRWAGFTHDFVGQKFAPAPATPAKQYVTTQPGDNLTRLAAAHHVTVTQIKALNPHVKGPDYVIGVGAKIRVR